LHLGRQLDGAESSIRALPAVVDAVGSKIEVWMDGGIRSGQDVLKAVALAGERGATTVGLCGYAGGKLAKMVDHAIIAENDCIEQVEDIHVILEHMITSAMRQRMRAAVAAIAAQ